MGGRRRNVLVAGLLLSVFLISLGSPLVENTTQDLVFEDNVVSNATPTGQSNIVSIGSYPDGVNDAISIDVPSGEAVASIDLSLDENVLPVTAAKVWNSPADYDHSAAVYDGMDVNNSVLQLLPQGWSFDFEGTNTWTLGSAWFIGKDTSTSSRPITGAVPSGTNTLYSHNGNYPNNMGSTIWATSPVMNCGGCSGGWDLTFKRQLGVESSSWDHAYVQIKSSSGSWTNIWQNSGSVSDGSFTSLTYTISNYISGNSNLQVRFGIGRTDSSVQYSGWNIDDIEILPKASGVSTGEGNWTSQPFGPGATLGSEPSSYGLMVIDAEIPTGSLFEWSLIDAATGTAVPGYSQMTDLQVDLGAIDWEATPSLRFQTHMMTGQSGGPKIHSLGISGAIHESFSANPATHDWILAGTSWSATTGLVSGTGSLTSPMYKISNGFGAVSTSVTATGAPLLEANVDDTGWQSVSLGGYDTLDEVGHSVQFRFTASSGSYSVDSFDVETVRSNPSTGLRIDIGPDGVADWGLDGANAGSFGFQNRLATGQLCQTITSSPSTSSMFEVLLPLAGINDFAFTLNSNNEMKSPYMNIKIAGSDVTNRGFANFQNALHISFSQTELSALNSALSNAADDRGILGLPMARVSITIGSSQSTADVTLCGIFAPYDAGINMNMISTSSVVKAMNQQLSSIASIGGVKELRIPIRMMSSGSIKMTLNSISTTPTLNPVSLTISPPIDTLTPSTDWITVNSTFDLSPLGVSDAESFVKNNGWSIDMSLRGVSASSSVQCSSVLLPLSGASTSNCQQSGYSLGWSDIDSSGEISMVGSGSYLQFTHRFQMPMTWDDEPYASMNVMLVSPTGPTLPLNHVFGLGHANGVENDVSLKRFTIESQSGIETDAESALLIPNTFVTVHAYLGFEGVSDAVPRTGQALVRLLVNGQDKGSTNLVVDGVASIIYNVPSTVQNLTMELEVTPLLGQGASYEVNPIASFTMDTIAPMLISMDIDEFDHRDASPATEVTFIIGDNPTLPHHAMAKIWRSWMDDSNMDGKIDEDEVQEIDLESPQNMLASTGEFVLTMDTSSASEGSYVQGWLSVADGAGNIMIEGGSIYDPLFNIQLRADGTPSLGTEFDLQWGQHGDEWLHPGEAILLQIPIWDKNGVTDIEYIELDIGSTATDPATIYWNSNSGQCYTNHVYIDVESCEVLGGDDVFSEQGTFNVNFSIEWGFDPDPTLLRVPSLYLEDRLGQFVTVPLYDSSWHYSGEITLDTSQTSLSIDDTVVSPYGAWASTESTMAFEGEIVWYRSHRILEQSMDLLMRINGEESVVDSHGNFSYRRSVPSQPGEHGLFVSMYNPPSGAVLRGLADGPLTTIFVDNTAPILMELNRPDSDITIAESDWSSIDVTLSVRELSQLNPDTLTLHYSIHPAGLGLNVASMYEGSESMTLLGGRAFGESIPISATLDIDELISESERSDSLELRIWVTGSDMAGNAFSEDFNDIDAPYNVWDLEQRIPEFEFVGTPELKDGGSIRVDDSVPITATIINNGNADGSVQVVLELVESNGARTRVDARQLQVQPGSTVVYESTWVPTRTGTMWLEVQIMGGETAQTPTLRVKDAESEGFLGTVSEVNPVMLGILGVLSIVLVGLLVFGLRSEPQRRPINQKKLAERLEKAEDSLPALAQQQMTSEQGPYGAQTTSADVGQNPYQ